VQGYAPELAVSAIISSWTAVTQNETEQPVAGFHGGENGSKETAPKWCASKTPQLYCCSQTFRLIWYNGWEKRERSTNPKIRPGMLPSIMYAMCWEKIIRCSAL